MPDPEEFLHQDMPFEMRCAEAKQVLEGFRNDMKNIGGDALNHLQDVDQRTAELKERFADNPHALKFLEDMHIQSRESINKNMEDVRAFWEDGLALARLAWGADAVDFAVAAMQHEARFN